MMGKTEDVIFGTLNFLGELNGNPYSLCPKCGRQVFGTLDYNNEKNPTIGYTVIRKTLGRIPIAGSRASRFIAEKLYNPTYSFYCHKCDYEWTCNHKDAK